MKKFFTIFFVSLGVIFFCLLLALAYFWIADPYNIKPFIFDTKSNEIEKTEVKVVNTNSAPASANTDTQSTTTVSTGGGLSEGQKNALELVGIDPAVLPERLTPEQEKCFVSEFGQTRVDEIKAGDSPTALEVLAGKHCL